ncbi:FAD-dependent oxidoreductase [Crocinitomicaceae bacterium CZZ-1]|uniref:FAD-dependent oxidoreductase n=1 Tax=Taishania pollutisoli TaxID=2766479 RepID=A0A8J6TRE2_9FLAO|nr:FAD-dependent oxidoreductase [Taishania pollutisoli]MBC9810957.1 FAD-dependent oxidoreductase [Taishania pollutisoli]
MKLTSYFILAVWLCSSVVYSQNKIAIIGGGIAGVSAAHYLRQYDAGAQITLFEKEAILGGNAQTVAVTTISGEKCMIDIGPQYFTKGPWDDYLGFLKETIGMNAIRTETMAGTLLVQRQEENTPLIVTPLNGKFRGEKLGKLLKLKKFNTEAFNVYKNPEQWKTINVQQWVEQLDFTDQYKQEIIYPFLAASLGTTTEDIRKTSVVEIVSLFAFRKPKASNSFCIMQDGMGTLIQQVGNKLRTNGVKIETNAPVQSVKKNEKGYTVYYVRDGKIVSMEVDFVMMAVHADVAAKLVKDDPYFGMATMILEQLPYFEAHIVIHQDTNYINTEKPAFLNIYTNKENQLRFSTMNLSLISPRLNGIYKSWMPEEDTQRVKEKGLLLHETTFYHPLITPEFVAHLHELKVLSGKLEGICIIGGWTEGLETQNSAVVSAKRAVEVYKNWK